MYGQTLEQVQVFRFLGLWFNSRSIWKKHIINTSSKCKKLLNVMSCISGAVCAGSKGALKNIYIALIMGVVYMFVIQSQAFKYFVVLSRLLLLMFCMLKWWKCQWCLTRKMLMISYLANLQGHAEDRNPATKVTFPCWDSERAKSKFICMGQSCCERNGVRSEKIHSHSVITSNSW